MNGVFSLAAISEMACNFVLILVLCLCFWCNFWWRTFLCIPCIFPQRRVIPDDVNTSVLPCGSGRVLYCNENGMQYVNTLMMKLCIIGYGNVVDMYIELNHQLVVHHILMLCLLCFDMWLVTKHWDDVYYPIDWLRSKRHEQPTECFLWIKLGVTR